MSALGQAITVLFAVGAATAAGTFFTFSTFAMNGLAGLAPAQGAAAMQSINREAPTPPFMLLLFGTAATSILVMIYAALRLDQPSSIYQLVAGGLYLVGVIILTVGYHVPRNNRLDALDADSPEGEAYWSIYQRDWVRMNHVRALAPFAAAVLLTVSLLVG